MKILIHGTGVMARLTQELAEDRAFTALCADEFSTERGDVIISFSHFSRMSAVLDYSLAQRIPLVVATTGWGQDIETQLSAVAKDVPVLVAANTSLGINVVQHILKNIVPILSSSYNIEIVEKHHNKKEDAPSGTAKSLARSILESSPQTLTPIYGREGHAKRHQNELGIHTLRGGTVVGEHSVFFFGEDETIEISHTASSKKIFAKGALEAATFLVKQKAGLYSMDDIFK